MADTTDNSGTHNGACRCGGVRVVAHGAPLQVSYCHCDDCRKATGAPVSAFVGFPRDKAKVEGRVSIFSAEPVERGFCPECGTPVLYDDKRLDAIWFMIGVMDNPENYAPQSHAFARERLPWLDITDGLPRHDTFSVNRED